MDYVICSKVLESAKNNKSYLTDLLLPFANSSNPIKVIKNTKILESYKNIANSSVELKMWISLMGHSPLQCWKHIENNDIPIFTETCKKSFDKKLIVAEKEDYETKECKSLTLINKDEAIHKIKPDKTKISIINSKVTNTTIGNNNS